ncbi:MAG: Hcp family type VI secretion system effector [Candidatus Binataceae bacterium]
MAIDYFIKLDGIDGESEDKSHTNWIDVLSFSWGATQPGSFGHGQGGTVGKVSMSDFSFSMQTSKATPAMLKACASGKHIASAILVCRKATGDGGQMDYMTWTMKPIIVSSYQTGGSSGADIPIDSVSINYESVKIEYKTQTDTSGALSAVPSFEWNVSKNTPSS